MERRPFGSVNRKENGNSMAEDRRGEMR